MRSGIFLVFLIFISFTLQAANSKITIPKIKAGQPLPADLFIQIARKINPSVVNISISSESIQSPHNTDLLERFFLFPNRPKIQPRRPRTLVRSVGSGFILESQGYVVTNAHVIKNAQTITIQVKNDPTIYPAKIVGSDKYTDIALLKISLRDSKTRGAFPSVDIGDSNVLQVGEWVAAFGNPFGHSNTMTKGIISAINRRIDELNLLPFLQTDASINPGNSGGPLVNTQGQVIGVNTAINPRAQNIGFAIPIHNVMSILKSLKKYGSVKRGFFGVQMNPESIKLEVGSQTLEGVLIVDVVADSPADHAKIKINDIITQFNNLTIKSSRDLFKAVAATPIDQQVTGTLYRNNKLQVFTATIKERPRAVLAALESKKSINSSKKAPFDLGFSVLQPKSPLPPNLNLPSSYTDRPVVTRVLKDSLAHSAGLKRGDIIFNVNQINVRTSKDVFKHLSSSKHNTLQVLRFDQPGRFNLKRITIVK